MAHLTLAGVSDDGKRLLLLSDAGVEFTLDIEPRLRAALRGEHARLGQLEIQMESTLRPRDIQARIRAGETPEAVAQAAQTTVDRIMAFAAPVLAERQHVADRAQRSSVRRKSGDPGSAGGARTLGDAVTGHLRSINVDPDTVEWDAWRREDGRWTLTGEYSATKRKGAAHFTYDGPGNYVTADNDDARWLLGESVAVAQSAEVRDDLRRARQRKLTSVPEDELPLGDDAIELVTGAHEPAFETDQLDETADRADETAAPDESADRLGGEMPLEAFLSDEPPADDTEVREQAADAVARDTEGERERDVAPVEDEPQTRRTVKKRGGRASVPSWDEIMFGGGKSE